MLELYTEQEGRKLQAKASESDVVHRAQAQLFGSPETSFGEKMYRAVSFHSAQASRFDERVLRHEQSWTSEAIEFHMEPA